MMPISRPVQRLACQRSLVNGSCVTLTHLCRHVLYAPACVLLVSEWCVSVLDAFVGPHMCLLAGACGLEACGVIGWVLYMASLNLSLALPLQWRLERQSEPRGKCLIQQPRLERGRG